MLTEGGRSSPEVQQLASLRKVSEVKEHKDTNNDKNVNGDNQDDGSVNEDTDAWNMFEEMLKNSSASRNKYGDGQQG